MLQKKQKETIVKKFGGGENDTGSPEVQIALLTKQIQQLTTHLKKHRKDFHSRRGLLQMVADRHAHLRYLKRKNPKRHDSIVKKMGLE